ncbi:MAG: phage major capsid protein, partial [Anaerotignum sp.]|nr:phage major capsid protein [Anaerotignum sp.]
MNYMKQLKDQRDLKTKEMKEILDGAKTETRAMNEEEQQKWDELDKAIKNIDKTIEAEKRAIEMNGRKKDHGEGGTTETEEQKKEREAMEERAFCDFVLGAVENRAGEGNLSYGNSGAIIPTSIANRIITEVKERSPILQRAEVYFVKGNLSVPVYGADDEGNDITVAFTEDFAEITANGGKFKSVDLKGYLMGALALVGRQLRNNAAFDVVGFVVSQMAEKIALFLEGKL